MKHIKTVSRAQSNSADGIVSILDVIFEFVLQIIGIKNNRD